MTDSMIGKGIDRLDARLKVTGKATYDAEVAVANVTHGVIVAAPRGKGRITAIDAAAADRAPGVLSVLTHVNAPKLAGAAKKSEPTDRALQILQDDQVHYAAQPIAFVVADTLEHARYAASLVNATIDGAPVVLDLESERPHAYPPKSLNGKPADTNKGDFDKAFAGAKVKVEQTYTTPDEHHNPMEMHSTVAIWQGDDKVTVYDGDAGHLGRAEDGEQRLRPEDRRRSRHLALRRRRLRVQGLTVVAHRARRDGGESHAASGQAHAHAPADVLVRGQPTAHLAEDRARRGRGRQAGRHP